jgi:hypothetical protein
MPRGGKRDGKVGKAYSNRGDLNGPTQPAKAPTGQTYGQAGAQMQAQKALPLPNVHQVAVKRGADGRISGVDVPAATPPEPTGGPPPGSLGPLSAPTARPGEPLTNGIDSGPGAGAEAMGMDDGSNMVKTQLRALYQQYPLDELAELIAEAD